MFQWLVMPGYGTWAKPGEDGRANALMAGAAVSEESIDEPTTSGGVARTHRQKRLGLRLRCAVMALTHSRFGSWRVKRPLTRSSANPSDTVHRHLRSTIKSSRAVRRTRKAFSWKLFLSYTRHAKSYRIDTPRTIDGFNRLLPDFPSNGQIAIALAPAGLSQGSRSTALSFFKENSSIRNPLDKSILCSECAFN